MACLTTWNKNGVMLNRSDGTGHCPPQSETCAGRLTSPCVGECSSTPGRKNHGLKNLLLGKLVVGEKITKRITIKYYSTLDTDKIINWNIDC